MNHGYEELVRMFSRFGGDISNGRAIEIETFERRNGFRLPDEIRSLYSHLSTASCRFKNLQISLLSLDRAEEYMKMQMGGKILNYVPILDIVRMEGGEDTDDGCLFFTLTGHELDGVMVRGDRRSFRGGGGGGDVFFTAHDLYSLVSLLSRFLSEAEQNELTELCGEDFSEIFDVSKPMLSFQRGLRFLDLALKSPDTTDAQGLFSLGLQLVGSEHPSMLTKYANFPGFIQLLQRHSPTALNDPDLGEVVYNLVEGYRISVRFAMSELVRNGYGCVVTNEGYLLVSASEEEGPVHIDLSFYSNIEDERKLYQELLKCVEDEVELRKKWSNGL